MTLFELLLVLVLLVVIASLAAPLLTGSFASVRLRSGMDQVLASWAETRARAIESGEIFQFRFSPAGNKYRVEPWPTKSEIEIAEEAEESSALSSTDSLEKKTVLPKQDQELTLPDQIVFVSGELLESDEVGERQASSLQESVSSKWSRPILFFPDGTASTASVLLRNERQLHQRAILRALTGVGRASELLSKQEIAELKSR